MTEEGIRLQKVLSQAGIASRRAAERMIYEGRVEVDGEIVMEQGRRINPDTNVVRVDGVRVVMNPDLVYLALNKPFGMLSTMSDDQGRPCIGDVIEHKVRGSKGVRNVGRLDAETVGLILLTNDGDLTHRLMHPSFEVPKTYVATVAGTVPRTLGKQLRAGVTLDDGPAKVDEFKLVGEAGGKTMLELTLHEGRNRIVRRMLDAVGHPVVELVRIKIGDVALGNQRPGSLRALGRDEVGSLYKAVGL